jgi:hypothetical protein
VANKTRVHADKSEQLFIEMGRGFADSQKLAGIVANLDSAYSSLQRELGRKKLDYTSIVRQQDFNDFKKMVNNKNMLLERSAAEMQSAVEGSRRVEQLVEIIVSVTEQNKRDIADIAVTIGDDHIKRVADYDEKLASILEILDSLAGEIAKVKSGPGRPAKIIVKRKKHAKSGFRHMKVHPDVAFRLSARSQLPGIKKIRQQRARLLRDMEKMNRLKKMRRMERKMLR